MKLAYNKQSQSLSTINKAQQQQRFVLHGKTIISPIIYEYRREFQSHAIFYIDKQCKQIPTLIIIIMHDIQAPSYNGAAVALQRSKLKTLPSLSSLKATIFFSKAQRFNYEYQDQPGPGSYEQPPRKTADFRIPPKQNLPLPKHHLWLISRGRQPFQMKQDLTQLPTSEQNKNKNAKQSNWPKNMRFNYEKIEKKTQLGPGKYNLLTFGQKKCSEMPKRVIAKAYLDELIKDRKLKRKFTELSEQLINQKIQLAKMLSANQDNPQQKQSQSPVFKSKSKRLYSQRQLIQKQHIGPGTYNIDAFSLAKRSLPKKKHRLNEHTKSCLDMSSTEHLRATPGPGAYEVDKSSPGQKQGLLGYIPQGERFAQAQEQALPGPADYMKKRFVYINEMDHQKNHLRRKEDQESTTFGMSQRFINRITSSPFGQYQMDQYDISHKINSKTKKPKKKQIRPIGSLPRLPKSKKN